MLAASRQVDRQIDTARKRKMAMKDKKRAKRGGIDRKTDR
jgi:hypothetical protein